MEKEEILLKKSGFAVLVGRSNVGKSTLLNALVGSKIAITTPKAQTTRQPIHGIINDPRGQIVFVDTPGVFKQSKDLLSKKLLAYIDESLKDIDVILYVVDPTRVIGTEERFVLDMVKKIKTPVLFVINKTEDKPKPFIDSYRRLGEDFETVLEVSAKSHKNLNRIVEAIFKKLPEGEPFYPIGQFTNISNEKWLAEIIREKLFLRLREEVPYSIHVIIDESEKRPSGTFYVRARILTSEERYKGMIVGKGGRGIKEIGQSTRRELETVMDCQVFLDLSVEHDPYWVEEYT